MNRGDIKVANVVFDVVSNYKNLCLLDVGDAFITADGEAYIVISSNEDNKMKCLNLSNIGIEYLDKYEIVEKVECDIILKRGNELW